MLRTDYRIWKRRVSQLMCSIIVRKNRHNNHRYHHPHLCPLTVTWPRKLMHPYISFTDCIRDTIKLWKMFYSFLISVFYITLVLSFFFLFFLPGENSSLSLSTVTNLNSRRSSQTVIVFRLLTSYAVLCTVCHLLLYLKQTKRKSTQGVAKYQL